MSIKTLRKRIALVAVSALGVGLLSVAPASAAAGASVIFSDDYLVSSTTAIGTNEGVCYVSEASTTTYTANQVATAAQNSANVVEMLSTGKLKFAVNGSPADLAATDDYLYFEIASGDAVWSAYDPANSTPLNADLSTDQTSFEFSYDTGDATVPDYVVLTPTAAGSITVNLKFYDASGDAGTRVVTVKTWNITAKAPGTGCNTGIASVADSYVKLVASGDTGTIATSNNDASGASTAANGGSVYARIDINDANGVAVPGASAYGMITAEVTGGLRIGEAGAIGTTSTVFTATKANSFRITQGTANTPQTGTLTIKIGTTVVGTKTVTITGPAAKIVTSSLSNVRIGQTQTAAKYEVLDSAGNKLAIAIDGYKTFTDAQAKIATAGTSTTTPAPSTATKGEVSLQCSGATGGLVKGLQLKEVVSATVTVYSDPFDVQCGAQTVANYKASLDKATYVPGDIATLTITATDAYGNPVSDDAVLGSATAGQEVAVAGSNLTAVSAPTNADKFTGGKKTYRFTVGSTEGNYNMVVDLAKYNTTTFAQSAQTVSYSIKAPSTGAVSNAEVLAAIVKLIASINKQIRALQKSLKR